LPRVLAEIGRNAGPRINRHLFTAGSVVQEIPVVVEEVARLRVPGRIVEVFEFCVFAPELQVMRADHFGKGVANAVGVLVEDAAEVCAKLTGLDGANAGARTSGSEACRGQT